MVKPIFTDCGEFPIDPNVPHVCQGSYTVTDDDIANQFDLLLSAYLQNVNDINDRSADATLTTSYNSTPSIQISKSSVPATNFTNVGQEIQYTITITNTGNQILSDIYIYDTLVAPDPNFIPSLMPGISVPIVYTYTVTQVDIDRGTITNQANVEARNPIVADSIQHIIIGPTINPQLTITKESTSSYFQNVDDPIEYTLTVHNSGNVTLDVNLTDSHAPLGTNCNQSTFSLAPGASSECKYNYIVNALDVVDGQIINIANVTGTTTGLIDPITVSAQAELILQYSSVSMTKTVSNRWYKSIGDNLIYDIVVKNDGTLPVLIRLSDTLTSLPAGCDMFTLQSGESHFCQYPYTVIGNDTINTKEIKNTATAEVFTQDGIEERITTIVVNAISSYAALRLDMTVVPTTYYMVGQPITYNFQVTNLGATNLTNIEIQAFGTNITIPGILTPGNTIGTNYVYNITGSDLSNGFVTTQASATGSTMCTDQGRVAGSGSGSGFGSKPGTTRVIARVNTHLGTPITKSNESKSSESITKSVSTTNIKSQSLKVPLKIAMHRNNTIVNSYSQKNISCVPEKIKTNVTTSMITRSGGTTIPPSFFPLMCCCKSCKSCKMKKDKEKEKIKRKKMCHHC